MNTFFLTLDYIHSKDLQHELTQDHTQSRQVMEISRLQSQRKYKFFLEAKPTDHNISPETKRSKQQNRVNKIQI